MQWLFRVLPPEDPNDHRLDLETIRALIANGGLRTSQITPTRKLTGEERLWLAVLLDAIGEYASTFSKDSSVHKLYTDKGRKKRRAELTRWFAGRKSPVSFLAICRQFAIDPEKVRALLVRIEQDASID